ncbi:MAG: response regulator transcription factor [Erysipelotrichaceae bacterium]|jgi:DNA-binding response OmpR family regulator
MRTAIRYNMDGDECMEESGKRILIAEDDADIVAVLRMYLENSGYEVRSVNNGLDALHVLQEEKIDLCLVDIMMPKMNGFDLIRRIREESSIPVLVLSARKEDSDKILGLNLGADDYIAKPFNPLEVLARIQAVLRRTEPKSSHSRVLHAGDLRADLREMKVYRGDEEIPLTPTEFRILVLFMEQPGRVFTKEQIASSLNGTALDTDENTIMVHISHLREKLEENPRSPVYLITVRGLGYKLGEKK